MDYASHVSSVTLTRVPTSRYAAVMDQTTADHKVENAITGLQSRAMAFFIYGVTAFGVGLAMFFTGAPSDLEAAVGPEVRAWLGAPLLLAGIAIMAGSFVANEHRWAWWSALLGMCEFSLWAMVMAITYAWITIEHHVDYALPSEPIDTDSGRLYITVFYQGVMLIAGVQIWTLMRLGRPPKSR